jgi:hypothetical protein
LKSCCAKGEVILVVRGFLKMRGPLFFGWSLLFFAPVSAEASDSLFKIFSPSPVHSSYRHRFESAQVKDKKLELRLWYEDSSVTRTGQPTDEIFCKIAHTLIFGRHRSREGLKTFAIADAFKKQSSLQSIELAFFSVYYTNKPMPPEWDKKPQVVKGDSGPAASKLRVVWAREEKAMTYLTYSLSRGEWGTLAAILQGQETMNFDRFRDEACGRVLQIAPNLRANYRDVQIHLESQRSGLKR